MRFTRTILKAVSVLVALCSLSQPALSHSGIAQDPWNPAHLAGLPREIQAEVRKLDRVCGGPVAAAQRFALYLTVSRAQLIVLHFDDLRCRNKAALCSGAGCLHEVYVSTAGRYRRVLAVHAYDVRLSTSPHVVLEILDAKGTSRALRWSGSRFVGP